MTYIKSMLLSESKKGTKVMLKKMNIEKKLEEHLKNLGLIPGTHMDILLNTINGTVLLVREGKLALGREVSAAMEVELVDGQMLC